VRVWQGERGHGKFMLSVDMEGRATGYENFEIGSEGEEIGDNERSLKEMLEIVQEEEDWRRR